MGDLDEPRATSKTGSSDRADERAIPVAKVRPARRKWPYVLFGIVVVLPIVLFTAWTEVALHWPYSVGNRAGFIQKFSQKGWVCKTYEGELAMVNVPGAAQEKFLFTVRDDSVAALITKLTGSHVAITYQQHRGIPGSCFGDTEYFVVGVRAVP